MTKLFDVVTVGHFAIDHITSPHLPNSQQALGGPPAYVSLAARKFDVKVGVVSKVGGDFPESYAKLLCRNDVDLLGVKRVENASTTSFALKYTNGTRQLRLKNRAPPILLEDLPTRFEAKSIHIAPIVDEISSRVVDELRKRTDTLSIDPQGFLRRFDVSGRVGLKKWMDRRVLEQVDVYKSSLQEVRAVSGLRDLKGSMKKILDFGVKIVIVTMGMNGAVVSFEGTFCRIPAHKSEAFMDATGAGDTFAGAFLAEYVKKKDPVWCACAGSAAVSFKVETAGPKFAGSKQAIYKRAERLYETCMRTKTHNGL